MTKEASPHSLSTSQNVSGDVKLGLGDKLRWLHRCYQNNGEPFADVDPRIAFANFSAQLRPGADSRAWGTPPVSPSRFLCDAFWASFDFTPLSKDRPIRALEVGCGTGIYGQKLKQRLGDGLSLYRGIDVVRHREWEGLAADSSFEFHVGRAESISEHLAGINLVLTQSAIEHFEHDLVFFRQLAEYVSKAEMPVWQIHLMPSAECLQTYLWHGYRQYTPRTLSKITRLFSSNTRFEIYRLGGARSNKVHTTYVTLPTVLLRTDLREKATARYVAAATAAVLDDQNDAGRQDASFYALVMKSNGQD